MYVSRLQKYLIHNNLALGILVLAWLSSVLATEAYAEPSNPPRTLLRFLNNSLEHPVRIIPNPSDTSGLLIAERGGTIEVFDGKRLNYRPLLDIEELFEGRATYGLIDIQASNPQPGKLPTFFIAYKENHGDVIVARLIPKKDSTSGERELYGILKIARLEPNSTHVALSVDKYENLYVATGKARLESTPKKLDIPRAHPFDGTILRIRPGNTTGYTIPKRNTCKNSTTIKPEVWRIGIHNPLALWHDPNTAKLFVADDDFLGVTTVYQASSSTCSSRSSQRTLPSTRISHQPSTPPIVAGIYTGRDFPELNGMVIYGDSLTGKIFAIQPSRSSGDVQQSPVELAQLPNSTLSAIGYDGRGRIYLASNEGKLWRVEPNS